MPMYNAGQMIRELRRRKKLSQEILCEGLCEPPTLSKIECCRQNPTKKLFEALMSRLGSSAIAFNIPVTTAEFIRGQIEREVASSFANSNYNIDELLLNYASCSETMDKLEKQFYLFAKAVSELKRNKLAASEAFEILSESLKQTFPEYDTSKDFSKNLLTVFELVILNNIAITHYMQNQKTKGIELLLKIENYFSTHEIEIEEYAKQYPVIADNLTAWLAEQKQFKKAFIYAKKGVECCIKYGKLSPLPILTYNLGFLSLCLNEEESGINYVKQSISLLKLMGRESDIEMIKQDFNSSFPAYSEKIFF